MPLALSLAFPSGRARIPLRLRLGGAGRAQAVLRLVILPPAIALPHASATWALAVTLAGEDISGRITGPAAISAAEGAARLADVSYRPEPGPLDLLALVGRPVIIDAVLLGVPVRRFTGVVDAPSIDPDTGVVTLHCTDNLQAHIDDMDVAEIDALTAGAAWSDQVFDPALTGWERADARMSTLTASISLDAYGVPRVVPWAAGAATRTLTRAHYLDGSLRPTFAALTSMPPRVEIDIRYRYPRLKVRGVELAWEYGWGEIYAREHGLRHLPSDAVIDALTGSGWTVGDITFHRYPTGWQRLPGGGAYVLYDPALCRGFRGRAHRRYAQQVEEHYRVVVRNPFAPAAVQLAGPLSESFALQVDAEIDDWLSGPPPASNAAQLLSYLPLPAPTDRYTVPVPAGAGESWLDVTDRDEDGRDALATAAAVLVARAVRRIQESLRASEVEFDMPADPTIDLTSVLAIETGAVTALGRVRRWREVYDHDTGTAVTTVALAVAPVGYMPQEAFALDQAPPGNPEIRVSALSGACGNHVGSVAGAPELSAEQIGFFTNARSGPEFDPEAPSYPEHFTVELPEVDPAHTELLEAAVVEQEIYAGSPGGFLVLEVV
ncbi:hypothetical protein E6O51_11765 [Pseudothauera rhizosphaerae]|uniref:Uncharacterized protein n=2 Tax=Pseudothauera rhizosphaerae TaxID=2565932 RepID=A0A4S4AMR8_9RHOO|nr:hypothetical protein E6O51_11765 [Pseudothauera rhizosphaerae]